MPVDNAACWQQGDHWLGYLSEFPEYWTQGETETDLLDHLQELFDELTSAARQVPPNA